jgi:hypothetical protein
MYVVVLDWDRTVRKNVHSKDMKDVDDVFTIADNTINIRGVAKAKNIVFQNSALKDSMEVKYF